MPDDRPMCIDRVLPRHMIRELTQSGDGAARAVRRRNIRWANGANLNVRFLNGGPSAHELVKDCAREWMESANIAFEFSNATWSPIRIAFEAGKGNWSYVGKENLEIGRSEATMNLEDLDRGTVLHEFGHCLGLEHEHQHPDSGIRWNEAAVIADLGGYPNFWKPQEVRDQVIARYSRTQTVRTDFDKKSIMLYSYPPAWTVDGWSAPQNTALSDDDRRFIGSAKGGYPKGTQATEIDALAGVAHAGRIEQPEGEDLYVFTVPAEAANRRLMLQTEGPTDVVMSLHGPDDRSALIVEDDDGGGDGNARIVVELPAGQYWLQVRHFQSGTGPYTLKTSAA